MLCTCQDGYEGLLERELKGAGASVSESGPGWVLCAQVPPGELPAAFRDLTFAHRILSQSVEVRGDSVNALSRQILDYFAQALRGERVEGPWPSLWGAPPETVGLSRRAGAVERAFSEALSSRLSRVARLASPETPWGVGPARGLFVWFGGFDRAWVARAAWINGPRRMADDPAAPSRSYLKVEEAYGIFGAEPSAGETVADLGAAPGGWSYSAARHGARVVAVDNGPLKGAALGHPGIDHRRADAFGFRPAQGEVFDWLFCDLLEDPHHVLQDLVSPWISGRWCRRLVVNLKFGRVDALGLLAQLRAPGSPLSALAGLRIRHLFHDREEFTIAGRLE